MLINDIAVVFSAIAFPINGFGTNCDIAAVRAGICNANTQPCDDRYTQQMPPLDVDRQISESRRTEASNAFIKLRNLDQPAPTRSDHQGLRRIAT